MTEIEVRQSVVDACRNLNALGVNQGTSGNVSVRFAERMLISPSAIAYEEMRPEQVAMMRLEGGEEWEGPCRPSTEWRFHRDILRGRTEVGAVVHAHPPFCTALAMARRGIPPCHYMVGVFGGSDVRCAEYATFGTEALSDAALRALEGRSVCLLANHGAIVCGPTLRRALWLIVELEAVARQYCASLAIGGPVLLSETEMAEARARLAGYGVEG
jgi:L-fuculose-phosphate aldolase